MRATEEDTRRARAAALEIIDRRSAADTGVLVTLELTVAVVLLTVMNNDPQLAARMLNEGLLQGVESRLAFFASKVKP